ncbi:MAG: hypothetical protein AABW52_03820, partial [Nanoarchaeota archaeon]
TEQRMYTEHLTKIRETYGNDILPEENPGDDGKGIDVEYYRETPTVPENQTNEDGLEAKVDDPANRTSFV